MLNHTTNMVLMQGNKKQMWVEKKYPILRTVLKNEGRRPKHP